MSELIGVPMVHESTLMMLAFLMGILTGVMLATLAKRVG